jgi:hypothetical protein
MGMTPKMISADAIIAKVSSDFDLGGTNWIPYAYEWIGFALQAIGGMTNLQRVKEVVTIKNHKVPMPCNLVHIKAIDYNGKQLLQSTTQRHMKFETPTNLNANVYSTEFPRLETDFTVSNNNLPEEWDKEGTTIASDWNTKQFNTSYGEFFYLTPETIVFSMNNEDVELHYDAIALDDRGYPLIPDSFEHQEAISHYILFKYLSRGNTHPAWNLQMAKSEWDKLKHQAYNRGVMPTLADAQNFQNAWNRIIFDHSAVEKFGEDLGYKQFNYNI